MAIEPQIIRQFPIFATLGQSELYALLSEVSELLLTPGEVLVKEGTRTEQVYLIIEGSVDVVKAMGPGEERLLAIRGPGTVIGEMSLFNDRRVHTATTRARTNMRVLVMTFLQFDRLIRQHPEIAYGMLRMVSRRLQETDELAVADLREKNRQLTRAYEELKAAQAALIEKEKLEHELDLAADIQRSILPQCLPAHPQWDFGGLMMPARMVGGDFYDMIPLSAAPLPQQVGLVVGDVCDKGIPAALYMGLVYSALRLAARQYPTPGEALRALNLHLKQISQSMMYVTLVYGVLDLASGQFSYARAGHPEPLVLDGENRVLRTLPKSGRPLGLYHTATLDEQTVTIPPGGTLLIFSDGLAETVEAREEPLEVAALSRNLLQIRPSGAQELCQRLWLAAGDGQPGSPPINDDFTVIAVRRKGL